jgi:hypothetical protein
VALNAKRRSSIYQGFAPIIGEEEANALLAQVPENELDVPATKDFVRAEIAELRTEIADLKTDIQRELRLHLVATLAFVAALVSALRFF